MKRAAALAERFEVALRHPELGDRERLLLQAYMHFEPQHGGACGKPGVCWPSDAELAAYLGRSEVTMRRARRQLTEPGLGIVRIEYVRPFATLPDGSKAWHGANVVTLLDLVDEQLAPVAEQLELVGATSDVQRLERQLALARKQVDQLGAKLAKAKLAKSSRNPPSQTGLDRSPQLGLVFGRGGVRGPRLVA